jgi:hypothetical protein
MIAALFTPTEGIFNSVLRLSRASWGNVSVLRRKFKNHWLLASPVISKQAWTHRLEIGLKIVYHPHPLVD